MNAGHAPPCLRRSFARPASQVYVRNKSVLVRKRILGKTFRLLHPDRGTPATIADLNATQSVNGILVQPPLPSTGNGGEGLMSEQCWMRSIR